MDLVSLNGTWELTYGPQKGGGVTSPDALGQQGWPTIPALVPGNVDLDMVTAGALESPECGNRIYALRELETYQWWYRRVFETPGFSPGERVELVFDGLDCFGTVWLNGHEVGATDNMLIAHRFHVTDLLRQGDENELYVRIDSAVLAGREPEQEAVEYAFDGNRESLHVRKAPHMYGWDIMPRAVTAGLWRGVRLEILPPTRWRSVYWAVTAADAGRGTATVGLSWDFVTDRLGIDGLSVRGRLACEGSPAVEFTAPVSSVQGRNVLRIDEARLWWPRGHGEPMLYDATLELIDADGTVLDTHESHVGLRTIKLRRTDITTEEEPGEFVFVVNGVKVFAKGTNWVPLDAFHSRDVEHLPAVLEMLADLNCNMVRCWGGNVYEHDEFYHFCDANGIMVWQDFSMACASYPQTDEFAGRIADEATAVVKRLRNHACLALWAGNNENDSCGPADRDPNDDRISRKVLPDIIRRLDPHRDYLPSSPYISPELVRRGRKREFWPEDHLWRRADYKDPFYTESRAHFLSEIGYHGCPDRKSLKEMFDPEFLWPWQDNDQWLSKSVRPFPNGDAYTYRIKLMAEKIKTVFGSVPDDLDDYILASQVAQAEAFKFFIEYWRQAKWRRTGILWWNLRDGWPILSDAIVDYYNRKKLAYHYIKRVQADVCAIVAEPVDGIHRLVVTNDTRQPAAGTVRVTDADTGADITTAEFSVPANDIATATEIPKADHNSMWLVEWTLTDGREFRNHYVTGSLPLNLADYKRWLGAMSIEC